MKIKEIAMAQWVNRLQNNIFINPLPYLYCVKFLDPYTYRNQVLWQAGSQANEIQVNFEISKGRNIQLVASFNQGTASLQPYQCIPAGFFR